MRPIKPASAGLALMFWMGVLRFGGGATLRNSQTKTSPHESKVQNTPKEGTRNSKDHLQVTCLPTETYQSIGECQFCTKFEIRTQHNPVCMNTGKKQKVKCQSSGKIGYVSCIGNQYEDKKKFWIFEGVMAGVAIIFNIAVLLRRQYLNAFLYQRLKRQFSDIGA